MYAEPWFLAKKTKKTIRPDRMVPDTPQPGAFCLGVWFFRFFWLKTRVLRTQASVYDGFLVIYMVCYLFEYGCSLAGGLEAVVSTEI